MSADDVTLVQGSPGIALRQMGLWLLGGLLVLLGVHVAGIFQDVVTAIRYPFQLDYAEGIVWQQAVLIPGPRMYSTSTTLPFIVFHYPPLYHLLARAARAVLPDFLAAGRLVSALSMIPAALSVMGIVLTASARPRAGVKPAEIAIAVAAGLLVLCLHTTRWSGMLMRVDMLAVAFAIAGLFVASRAAGRFWGTTFALLLCAAAVFTKPMQMPAGIAVFLIALVRNPRGALGAAAIVGTICCAALAFLERRTSGGFLLNIIVYNVNPMALGHAFWALFGERYSLPVMLLVPVAAWFTCRSVLPALFRGQLRGAFHQVRELRFADRSVLCRALLLLDLLMVSVMTAGIVKAGSSYNYFLDWLTVGCALLGVMLVDCWRGMVGGRWAFPAVIAALIAIVAFQPLRQLGDGGLEQRRVVMDTLVQQISATDKPVASEDMVLLMRGHKQIYFEPAIATALADEHIWDETPLVRMIRSGQFAFMITRDNDPGGNFYRTPAVDAAMRAAYPVAENAGLQLWLHLPSN